MEHDASQGIRYDLLQPTFEASRPPEPIFSSQALFFTAFFGGPIGIILLAAANSQLLGRLRTDLWRYLVATVATLIFFVVLVHAAVNEEGWLTALLGESARSMMRYINRGFALLVWVALYLPQRRYHHAAELSDLGSRSPWKAAILCLLVAGLAQYGLVRALQTAFGM